MKSQQNNFCTKKDNKFIFPTKVVIAKNCANCKNGYLNFFYKNNNNIAPTKNRELNKLNLFLYYYSLVDV